MRLDEIALNTIWIAYLVQQQLDKPLDLRACFLLPSKQQAEDVVDRLAYHLEHNKFQASVAFDRYASWNNRHLVLVGKTSSDIPRTVLVVAPTEKTCQQLLDRYWAEKNPPKHWKKEDVQYMQVEPDDSEIRAKDFVTLIKDRLA
jgi:hypothetical protein